MGYPVSVGYHTDTTPGFEAPPILVDPRNQALEAAKQGLVAATFEALMIRSDEAFEGLAPPNFGSKLENLKKSLEFLREIDVGEIF